MLAIFKREMRSYFTTVIGYAFLVIYLAVGAAIFAFTTLFSMSADVTTYYLYMMIFSAVILPLLTMKSFSEERKIKTEQLTLTAPVSLISIVLGKFLASMSVKTAVWLGNYVALLLVGMTFICIGLFVSSLTENQLSAAVGTIAIILAFLAIGIVNVLLPSSYFLRYVFDFLSIFTRFQAFTNGYFDLSSLIYYLSISAIFLYLTVRVYDRRRHS